MTNAQREAALAAFKRALGKYPDASEYLDEQRAIERRNAAQGLESLERSQQRAALSAKPIQI